MIRAIFAAFLGYVVMVACVMAGIAIVWNVFGNEFAFSGESTEASLGWSLLALLSGLVAAVMGGYVAALVGGPKGWLAVRVLIALILLFGGLTIVMQFGAEPLPLPDGVSIRDLDFFEAGQYAVSPMWYNFAIVVVGLIGVWSGGRLGGARQSLAAQQSLVVSKSESAAEESQPQSAGPSAEEGD